jgi:hypothetical protein
MTFSCGYRQNLDSYSVHFIEGAARDPAAVEKAVRGC